MVTVHFGGGRVTLVRFWSPLMMVFSGLSTLFIEGVEDVAGVIVVRASTPPGPVACPDAA
ncbi:hypothetical protein IL38_15910 [Actinopolyspora erythraea]|uniref:Uncharacterized protein n=1 Tax=Actinopolyspora erythraea TaxID=414996 RepID=A0ABR4X1W5_9ACTN|nr:hypothetical protein IL38_15910 [Actinopolyspora erythraea]